MGRAWSGGSLLGATALLVGAACAPVAGPEPVGPAGDRQLRERIELRLAIDHRLCPYALRVIVYHRTVELDGQVEDTFDRRRAIEIARAAGAARVVDRLELSLSSGDPGRC